MAQLPWDQPYNIILAGSYGVGKTSIFNKLSTGVNSDIQYGTNHSTPTTCQCFGKWIHTATVATERKGPPTQQVQVTLWDTGNMELKGIRNVTRSYFRQSVGVILVYDIGNYETLEKLDGWIQSAKDSFSWKWDDYISFMVWGNDRDQPVNSVSTEILSEFVARNGLEGDVCCEVNGHSGDNLFESYHTLIQKLHTELTRHRNAGDGFTLFGDRHCDLLQDSKKPCPC